MAGAAQLPQALLDPSAYPHATAGVRLVETHVSWVFLTGSLAYKVKKPVRLAFLDFSTAALRRQFCAEELRLNRHFAPDLYLGLSDVVATADGLRIDAPGTAGPAVDCAVRMREFAAGEELDNLLAGDQADTLLLADFGARLAGLHATAPVAAGGDDWAQPAATLAACRQNFLELGQLAPAALQSRIESLRTWTEARYRALEPAMRRRRAAGRCRECHGDLHCANVVRHDGRLVPFDALEFDPALRWIDVACDLAFLLMDLEARGRADLAAATLDGWLASGGDFDALRVLAFHLTYRALVRAKIAAIRGAQSGAPGGEADIERYVAEAERHAAATRPAIVITHGLSGSGKSWLAARLLASLGAVRLRSDVERKRLAGLAPDQPSDGSLYSPAMTALTYGRLAALARAAVESGYTALVDAAFLLRPERQQFADLARELGVPFRILAASAPRAVLEARLAERRGDASEATGSVLARQYEWVEPLTAAELATAVTVDTSEPVDTERLAARLGPPSAAGEPACQ